jgi:putative phosphonate catabolism associated alcohol dehydrogenase
MKTGRAAVYESPNTPFVIREYPVRDVKPDEALIRTSMSTICRSDIESYRGHRPNLCPGILGHEIIGIIEQLGADITHDLRGDLLAIGERVTWTEYFHQGHSVYRDIYDMPQKSPGIRKYGHDLVESEPHFLGGFAEYCYIMPGTGILKLPDAITDEEAAPLNCGVATMISITEAAKIEMGKVVVVQGLGLLGLYGCAIAKARGARMVIGLDAVEDRLEIAKKFGADETINVAAISEDALVEHVRGLCSQDGADIIMEVCGVASAVPVGVRMLRAGGVYIIGGLANPGSDFTLDGSEILKKMITLTGVHNYHPRHLIQALDFVMANRRRFPFIDIVNSKFSLDEIDEAFTKADERLVLRAAIVP